jgi:hypothetical protein
VHEHIVSAIAGLNEAKTLLAIEPLDSTCWHFSSPKSTCRATITRPPFNWSNVSWKVPAGAIRKAQRLIECSEPTGSGREYKE